MHHVYNGIVPAAVDEHRVPVAKDISQRRLDALHYPLFQLNAFSYSARDTVVEASTEIELTFKTQYVKGSGRQTR
jgi:hypothetical protein